MQREYHRWWSPRLERDMELLIFGHAGAPVLVFPTRGGRFFDYENWGMVAALGEKIDQGFIQLYCVDSIDHESLYGFWRPPHERIARHDSYSQYVLEEVLPLINKLNPDPFLIAHGCSLGAYHAVDIAFRNPDRFKKVVALSGRYDLTQVVGDFRPLFDDYYAELVYFHTPSHFIPQLGDLCVLNQLRQMEIIFAIGAADPFVENNRALSYALWNKGIWNALYTWDGEAHRPRYWRRMVQFYL